MQQDKSTVALGLVGVLALTIIGIVAGEIMGTPVTDLSLVATAIAGGLIGWLAPNMRRADKAPVEVEVVDDSKPKVSTLGKPLPTSTPGNVVHTGGTNDGRHVAGAAANAGQAVPAPGNTPSDDDIQAALNRLPTIGG